MSRWTLDAAELHVFRTPSGRRQRSMMQPESCLVKCRVPAACCAVGS